MSDDAEALVTLGSTAADEGMYDDAERLLSAAILSSPQHAQAWTHRGIVMQMQRRRLEALWCLDIACELDPESVFAWTARGALLNDMLWLDDAMASFDRALAIRDDAAVIHSRRGIALQNAGRYDEAMLAFNRATELDPNPMWHIDRHDCLLIRKRYDEAVAGYETVLRSSTDPEIVTRAKQGIGEARARMGKGFAGTIRKIFRIEPPNQEWKPAVTPFVDDGSRIEMYVKRGDGLFIALLRTVAEWTSDGSQLKQASQQVKEAALEQEYNPAMYQRLANEALMPVMRRIRTGQEGLSEKEIELRNCASVEDFVPKYLGWIYIGGFMSIGDDEIRRSVEAHTSYWNLELRYPGLAAEIWRARGKAPFAKGDVSAALRNEPHRLQDLHATRERDETAFLQSLMTWLRPA